MVVAITLLSGCSVADQIGEMSSSGRRAMPSLKFALFKVPLNTTRNVNDDPLQRIIPELVHPESRPSW